MKETNQIVEFLLIFAPYMYMESSTTATVTAGAVEIAFDAAFFFRVRLRMKC